MITRYILLKILVIVMQVMFFAQIAWCENDPLLLDVGTISIDIPDTLSPDTLSPQATVKNFGSDTVSFDVTCTIEHGGYLSTETVIDLAPDESIQVTFSSDFGFTDGLYIVTVSTHLAGDVCPENDTLVKIVIASYIDAYPVSIDIPDTVSKDTILNPQASVTSGSWGYLYLIFDVTCTIEPGGYFSDTTITLPMWETMQITFTPQFVFDSGPYVVTVSTHLAGDVCPENDVLHKTIYVHTGIAEENVGVPETFMFQVSTINRGKMDIDFVLAEPTTIELIIYDALGCLSKKLISDRFPAGQYHVRSHIDLCPGVYFCHLKTGSGHKIVKKFLFID
jgi:hypothetical protein